MSDVNLAVTFRFRQEPDLTVDEFVDVLVRSTLGERRPIDDRSRMAEMIAKADLLVTARDQQGKLVGVSRSITDFAYCTYLSDLAVDQAVQGLGIGKQLIQLTHEFAGHHTTLILLAAPAARTYYPHIGLEHHDSCWIIRGQT